MAYKLIRITTISASLDLLLRGQLGFLNTYYEVVGIAFGEESLHEKAFGLLIFLCPVKLVCGKTFNLLLY